jgi:hypothetical protein
VATQHATAAPADPFSPEYQLTRRDHLRQREAEQSREWVLREVAKAPPLTEEQREKVAALLRGIEGSPDRRPWQLRLYCGHVVVRDAAASNDDPFGESYLPCTVCGRDPAAVIASRPC